MLCCVAKLFKRDPLTFVALNVLRVLGIITLILVLASEIVNTNNNLHAFRSRNNAVAAVSSSNSTSPVSSSSATPIPTSTTSPRTVVSSAQAASTPRITAASIVVERSLHRRAEASSAIISKDDCGYIRNSNIPDQAGGIVFAVGYSIFSMFLLLFLLVSELPLPPVARFLGKWCPMLGPQSGVGWLGGLETYMACGLLSRQLPTFALVSDWMLFVIGCLNIVGGLVYGPALRELRAITPGEDSPVGKLTSHFRGAASDRYHDTETASAVGSTATGHSTRKVIHISPPMPAMGMAAPPYAPQMMERAGPSNVRFDATQ